MKKISVIIVVVIYAMLSVGVGVSSHYCMGVQNGISVFSFEKKGCACNDNVTSDSDCCDDEVDLVVLEDMQQFSVTSYSPTPNYNLLYTFRLITQVNNTYTIKGKGHNFDRPPPKISPLYKLNCTYTFYG